MTSAPSSPHPASSAEPIGHVVVVGGSGALGRRAAARARADGAQRVTIVGRDLNRTRAVADELGDGIEARAARVGDHARFLEAIADADVVLNNVAPHFEHRASVLDAVMETGSHYADACDDWEATVEILERDDTAEANGLVCVTGFGIAPGIDDALAALAMHELDSVESLTTAWTLSAGDSARSSGLRPGDVPVALVHFLHCCVGPIRVRREGSDTDVVPLELIELDHPLLGAVQGWTIGSPEAVTFQRTRPELTSNVNLMLTAPSLAAGLQGLAGAVRRGELDLLEAAALLVEPADTAEPTLHDRTSAAEATPTILALATGRRAGVEVSVAADFLSAAPPLSTAGDLLGCFPRWIADGTITEPGVHPLTDVLEPMAYLERVATLLSPSVDASDLVRMTSTVGRERSS